MKFRRDFGALETVMEQPGDLTVIATLRVMRKNGRVMVELEAEEGLSRRTLKKILRRAALELPIVP